MGKRSQQKMTGLDLQGRKQRAERRREEEKKKKAKLRKLMVQSLGVVKE